MDISFNVDDQQIKDLHEVHGFDAETIVDQIWSMVKPNIIDAAQKVLDDEIPESETVSTQEIKTYRKVPDEIAKKLKLN